MPRDPENDIRLAKLAEENEAKARAEAEQKQAQQQNSAQLGEGSNEVEGYGD